MTKPPSAEPIAIVGMACVFPEAPDLGAFWRNILGGVDAISEPTEAWDAPRYLESGRIRTASGGYLKELYRFDAKDFGVMPNSIDGGEPDQFLALQLARDVLLDAGYLGPEADHTDTGIVLGHSTYLHRGQGVLIQNHIVVDQTLDVLSSMYPELGEERLAEVRELLSRKLPAQSADTAPGLVPNVMTGRIANRLNLRGPNYLVDAACSSSLLAVAAAMDELRAGRSRLMIAGGVNASLPAEVSVIFSQLGALSGRGKVRPFEQGSDGTLLGEGLGAVALKRLSDALDDCDRIYAVLREVGQASDGRGQGLLAPSVEGETLAIQRAYTQSGIEPSTIGLIEAHGTGIPLGDRTEVQSLKNVFGVDKERRAHVPLGSVKSMISHCIPAAGIAGLIKTALSLHHKVLPPTLCEEVNPELGIEGPLYVNTRVAPWLSPTDTPRRAGINSFGFGGINTHAIVEEAPHDARVPALQMEWSNELFVFSAATREELAKRLRAADTWLDEVADCSLGELALSVFTHAGNEKHRLSLVAKDHAALKKKLGTALKKLEAGDKGRWTTRSGISYCSEPLGGQLAFLFPGEGSQFVEMLSELALHFSEVREVFDFWSGLYGEPPGDRRTDFVFPTPGSQEGGESGRLHDMDVGSEAVFVGGLAMHALLTSLGLRPDVMLGHSSGESTALAASGALANGSLTDLGQAIRKLNSLYLSILADGKIPTGALLSVGAFPPQELLRHMAACDPELVVAMDNCKNQQVVYGPARSVDKLGGALSAEGAVCIPLPFDRGYHTAAFEQVSAIFLDYYGQVGLQPPQVPLYSCASTGRFPKDVEGVRKLAADQWSQAVRFRETVEKMHEDGVRAFVEVGPSGNLTAFVNDTLAGRDYMGLASNVRQRGALEQLLTLLGRLFVEGRPIRLERLFEGRALRRVTWGEAAPSQELGMLLDNTMPRVRLTESDAQRLQQAAAQPASPPIGVPTPPPQPTTVPAPELEEQPVVDAPAGFLSEVLERDETHLTARCDLDLYQDSFLRDHVLSGPVSEEHPGLSGLSCVPMMVSLEIMAQAAAELAQSRDLGCIEDVEAFDWIALDGGAVSLNVHAEFAEDGVVAVQLLGPNGPAVRARYRFGPADGLCEGFAPLTQPQPSAYDGEALYTTGMFHGPIFQSIAGLDGWDGQGIDARLSSGSLAHFFVPGERPAFITNPVLLDATGQLVAYWIASQMGTSFNCFPTTIERIELYAPCPQEHSGMSLRARRRTAGGIDFGASAWDLDCVCADGTSLFRVKGLRNVFFPVPERYSELRRAPQWGALGERAERSGEAGGVSWRLPLLPSDFCGQSGEIFLRILAHMCLGEEERAQFAHMGGDTQSRALWLQRRVCVKEAVRAWVHEQTGFQLFPADIQVSDNGTEESSVRGAWCDDVCAAPRVTLGHNDEACWATVIEFAVPVGADRASELAR